MNRKVFAAQVEGRLSDLPAWEVYAWGLHYCSLCGRYVDDDGRCWACDTEVAENEKEGEVET